MYNRWAHWKEQPGKTGNIIPTWRTARITARATGSILWLQNITATRHGFPATRFSISQFYQLYRVFLYRGPENGSLITYKACIRRTVQGQPLWSGTRQTNILCQPLDYIETSALKPGATEARELRHSWYGIWYIFNRNWVDTRWQQCSTHLHTNSTQNTENGTYITIKKFKTYFRSAGRALSLRVIPWNFPYDW
jgi:hypothetical protein